METHRFRIAVGPLCVAIGYAGCSRHTTNLLTLYHENKLDEALPLFERLVSCENSNADYHAWLAETYRRLGRKAEAVSLAHQHLRKELSL